MMTCLQLRKSKASSTTPMVQHLNYRWGTKVDSKVILKIINTLLQNKVVLLVTGGKITTQQASVGNGVIHFRPPVESGLLSLAPDLTIVDCELPRHLEALLKTKLQVRQGEYLRLKRDTNDRPT